MSQTIEEFLAGLDSANGAMQTQVEKISEILEKSNSILLQMESICSLENTKTCQNKKPSKLQYECQMALIKILENLKQVVQRTMEPNNTNKLSCQTVMDDCLAKQERVEYLGSCMRKLVAFTEAVVQLKSFLVEGQSINDKENIDKLEDE